MLQRTGTLSGRWAVAVAACLLVLGAGPDVAHTQLPESDLLDILEQIPPSERARILRELGQAPQDLPERDTSAPEVVLPREPEPGDIGMLEPGPVDSMVEGEVPKPPPLEPLTGDVQEIRRAFRTFLAESQPLRVDENLRQFGYELFAGAPTTFAPATDIPVSSDYIIGPGDEVHIQLYGQMNLSTDLLVDRDGVISFPELGPIPVAGLTFREMKESIQREVENSLIGVEVGVSMGRLRSIRVFVLGDVYRPGSYTVSGLSTLTNALFSCGGIRKIGSLRKIQLKRGGETLREMDLYDLILKGDTSDDVRLMPDDVVFVPTVGPLVGVAGEVLRPAIYEMKSNMTARQLIDIAGGTKPTAYKDLIQVERIGNDGPATYDMTLEQSSRWELRGGDLVKIYPITLGDESAVFLEGNVVRPGKREYFDGMRLLDLVGSLDDLLPETFFRYGLIERESEINREPEYTDFDLGAAMLDSVPEANVPLKPRDRVYIFHRAHFRDTPMVQIRGEVRFPGTYEFKKDMRVLDLVLAAGGLTRDSWLDEAELFRTEPHTMSVERISISINAVLAGVKSENVILQDMDELVVHSVWEFKDRNVVQVLGEVNSPGTYPLSEGMRVSDLVFAGGNLKESAYLHEAELTRYDIVDGERRELHHVVIPLDEALSGSETADVLLRPYDRLLVRRITNWRGDEVVTVSGEVAFPGAYPIEEGERLSNLIVRFGGFLEDAYLEAAVFRREAIRELQREQLTRLADQLEADLSRLSVPASGGLSASEQAQRQAALEEGTQLLVELRQTEATGRMVVSLATAEDLRGTDKDVVLADGDELHVPRRPDFVMVMGQVSNPTAFHYEEGKRAGYYVDLAGGVTRFADSGETYVVKADGSVEKGRNVRTGPGDTVVVPETLERFAGMQFLIDISQVLYQLAIAAASAHTVWGN